jgi:hypothetical protein
MGPHFSRKPPTGPFRDPETQRFFNTIHHTSSICCINIWCTSAEHGSDKDAQRGECGLGGPLSGRPALLLLLPVLLLLLLLLLMHAMKELQPASAFPRCGLCAALLCLHCTVRGLIARRLCSHHADRFPKAAPPFPVYSTLDSPFSYAARWQPQSTCSLFCATIGNVCFCTPHPTRPTPTVQHCQPTALRGAEVCDLTCPWPFWISQATCNPRCTLALSVRAAVSKENHIPCCKKHIRLEFTLVINEPLSSPLPAPPRTVIRNSTHRIHQGRSAAAGGIEGELRRAHLQRVSDRRRCAHIASQLVFLKATRVESKVDVCSRVLRNHD